MTTVAELDLPELDLGSGELAGDGYHRRLARLAAGGARPWLARSPLAFLAPRMPDLAADGPAVPGGVEGIYGVETLPLRWSV